MTEQHECEWAIGQNLVLGPPKIMCSRLDCTNELPIKEAEARLNEYETLKKATEALSAERVRKMADEMETGRRISTSRHIRELRVYVAILEGK